MSRYFPSKHENRNLAMFGQNSTFHSEEESIDGTRSFTPKQSFNMSKNDLPKDYQLLMFAQNFLEPLNMPPHPSPK